MSHPIRKHGRISVSESNGDTMRHLVIALIALAASLFMAVSRANGIY